MSKGLDPPLAAGTQGLFPSQNLVESGAEPIWVWQSGGSQVLPFSPQAEKIFMVARGLVREARDELEGQQAKLKEVRDRLDRISRDDSQYLELATLEHRMLQVSTLDASPAWSGGQRLL